jgi:hypothetical protein
MLVIAIGVSVFAAFAASLAWVQSRIRPATVQVTRPKRRPF